MRAKLLISMGKSTFFTVLSRIQVDALFVEGGLNGYPVGGERCLSLEPILKDINQWLLHSTHREHPTVHHQPLL